MAKLPNQRLRTLGAAAPRRDAAYVVYWMTSARRCRWNYAFDHAVDWAARLKLPLVVFEPLRCDYPWASDRLHQFVIEGMRDNAAALAASPIHYYPYVEPSPGTGRGLLAALAERAALVVTDDYPCFFLPRMVERAAANLPVPVEVVDGNGLYPMRATTRVFTTAASFRRHLQKEIAPYLGQAPRALPWQGTRLRRLERLPPAILDRWPAAPLECDLGPWLAALPIDHSVRVAPLRGGALAASERLAEFVEDGLRRYPTERNDPESDAPSQLSAYLHFGHISAHEIFRRVMDAADWSPALLYPKATGSRSGWWGAGEAAEAFLDQLITWRELGFNKCCHDPEFASFESLPAWAQQTLGAHARDPRPYLYSAAQFEAAQTHDPLWNAAQRQLVREGTIHNYLRMLWGKKILEWSRSPREALSLMLELNNKYALDGRDPNSYSGIFWVLGRYDRAWGPERKIFGKVRYMSSANTARKVKVDRYLARYGPSERLPGL